MNKKEMLRNWIAKQSGLVEKAKTEKRSMTEEEQRSFDDYQSMIDLLKEESAPAPTGEDERAAVVAAERSRISEITTMCRDFGVDASSLIADGKTVDQARAFVLENVKSKSTPLAGIKVGEDEADKFRAAAVDALCMKSGFGVEKPAPGADQLRAMSLRDLAVETLSRTEGRNTSELMRMDKTALYGELCRSFYNPSAAFPAILDQAIKKNIVTMYSQVPTTFEQFTTSGTLSDFKTTPDHEYVMGGGGDPFQLVPENGELKASKPSTELLPNRKLETYGTQFSMSRQAFINDDIGFLANVPGFYAQKAKQKINKQVWSILTANGKIFDGKDLFCADHKNTIATGAAPSVAAIKAMILQMGKQVDQFGEAIAVVPRKLLVSSQYQFTLLEIFNSPTIQTTDNTQAVNPLYNYGIQPVWDPVLDQLAGTNACPWFMVAEPSSAKGIQVDYLNGAKTPTIRRGEQPGTLGFVWDIYMDWGISVRDFRGIYRNPGVKLS